MVFTITNVSTGRVSLTEGPALDPGQSCTFAIPWSILEILYYAPDPTVVAGLTKELRLQLSIANDINNLYNDGIISLDPEGE
jgi:hypothetical protein